MHIRLKKLVVIDTFASINDRKKFVSSFVDTNKVDNILKRFLFVRGKPFQHSLIFQRKETDGVPDIALLLCLASRLAGKY